MSCMVHTIFFPARCSRLMSASESMPWFIQLSATMSASRIQGCREMSHPVSASDTLKRSRRLKPLPAIMRSRSRAKSINRRVFPQHCATAGSSVLLFNTSMRVSTPASRRACMSRRDTIAAPPSESLLLTITTFIARYLFFDGSEVFNTMLMSFICSRASRYSLNFLA